MKRTMIKAGVWRIGRMVVTRHSPRAEGVYGGCAQVWKSGGKIIGYTLDDCEHVAVARQKRSMDAMEHSAIASLSDYNNEHYKTASRTFHVAVGEVWVSGIPYFFSQFAERAFAWASKSDAQQFCAKFKRFLKRRGSIRITERTR